LIPPASLPHLPAEVAPAAGVAAEGLAALFLILAFVVCIGLQKAWRATIGWVFTRLAQELNAVAIPIGFTTLHVFGPVVSFLNSVNAAVDHSLAAAALKCEAGAVWLFSQAAHQLVWMARETRALATAVWHALEGVKHISITSVTKVVKGVSLATVHAVTRPIVKSVHAVVAAEHALTRRVGRLEHELATAIPHALPGLIPRVGALEREWDAIEGRVKAIERDLAPAALAALIGATIFKLLPDFIRCPSLGAAGNKVGCIGFGLLADLLEPLFVGFAVADICDFVAAIEGIAEELSPLLEELVVVEDALVGCHGADAAPALSLPALALPPASLGLPLAA